MQPLPPCCNSSGQSWMQIKVVIFLRFPQTCHEDCKKKEKSKFAKQCAKDGGLFKCCIRRDKEYCHECRYCCTLSICTTAEGSRFLNSNASLAKVQSEGFQSGAPNAIFGYSVDKNMW